MNAGTPADRRHLFPHTELAAGKSWGPAHRCPQHRRGCLPELNRRIDRYVDQGHLSIRALD